MLLVKVLEEFILDTLKKLIISYNVATLSITIYTRYKALGIFPAFWTYICTISETVRLTNYAIFSLFYVKAGIRGKTMWEGNAPLGTYFFKA
jgi:hypothetical protein